MKSTRLPYIHHISYEIYLIQEETIQSLLLASEVETKGGFIGQQCELDDLFIE
jgi:hypothetical protein